MPMNDGITPRVYSVFVAALVTLACSSDETAPSNSSEGGAGGSGATASGAPSTGGVGTPSTGGGVGGIDPSLGGSGGDTGGAGPSTGGNDTGSGGGSSAAAGHAGASASGGTNPASGGSGAAAEGSGGALGGTGAQAPATGGTAGEPTAGSGGDTAGSGGTPDDPAAGAPSTTGGGSGDDDVVVEIQNGVFWNDTSGDRIDAHGGGFLHENGIWYWIGEARSGSSDRSVNCYSSTDLVNWTFENAVVTRSTTGQLSTGERFIERPKLIYNDQTQQYVMWVHWEGANYAPAEAGVFTSSTVCGDYTFVSGFRPNNNMSRDDTLFKDDDGKAYFISAANENADLVLYELTADYLGIERQVAVIWAGASREAPAMFKHEGRYYLITSACTGWDPNQGQYASATSIAGPWSERRNLGNNITYDTQPTYVIPVVGTRTTTYLYAGDRWQDPDLPSSKYIWLPLKISGNSLALDYYDRWQLNLTTGEWSSDDGFLSQQGWTLLYVDSEETAAENGSASNAFDDSSSTIWHTAYTGETPAHPHEIQIDLGDTYAVEGARFLPRQDADENGAIAQYEFYTSEDPADWGSPAASGTFDSSRDAKLVSFSVRNARYIRLVALSEINGGAWTSLAELDLVSAQ